MEVNAVSLRYKRKEHLKKNNEIREVYSKGKRISRSGARLYVLKNGLPYNRICFTLSRGYGNSVKRNRTKRLCREIYRNFKPRLTGGFDIILTVYSENTFTEYARLLEKLFYNAGLLK